jgi:hypothetical protein
MARLHLDNRTGFWVFRDLNSTATRTFYRCSFQIFRRRIRQLKSFKQAAIIMLSLQAIVVMLEVPIARAIEPISGIYVYTVGHSLFGDIGQYTVRLTREGEDVVVEVDARATIRLMFISLLRLHTSGREVWRDGKLMTFDGRSEENGNTIYLSARADEKRVVIVGPNGKRDIAAPIALTNPWHSAVLTTPVLLEPTTGGLLSVRTKFAGADTIEINDQMIESQKHIVSGDIAAEIWFADNGTWLKMEFDKAGGRVKIVLESLTPSEVPLNYALHPIQQK